VRIAVVQHQDDCPPALLGEWLLEEGAELDVRRPYAGDDLPADLDGHDALLVLGGSMTARDDEAHPWLGSTKQLFRDAARDGLPALGICLGHQLAAVALGGDTGPNPRGQQLGLLAVGWTGRDALTEGLGDVAVQWNDDLVLRPPDGTVVLARTSDGELQVARFAPTVWGVQMHPEVDDRILAAWAAEDPDRYAEGVIEDVLDRIAAGRARLVEAWRPLATSLTRIIRRGA
jgi:GMP synthase (glutamine-hydrolysing)